jgi:carboxymethylenebutenolidase
LETSVTRTLLALFLVLGGLLHAQDGKSCCAPVTHTTAFAGFGGDPQFRTAHLEPLSYVHQSQTGKMITFKTGDGQEGRGFEVKATSQTGITILMFHEWWGLNDYIKREADKLHDALGGKATVIALDLYDGKVATTREAASKFMSEASEERIRSIISGSLEYIGKQSKIGTIGWCFGGGWSLQAALMAGDQASACVMYYGMPETDAEKLSALSAPLLGIFAAKDGWITPAVVDKFQAAMNKAGKDLTVKSYDADHAFANPSNPQYDKESTEDAFAHVLSFFNAKLFK